MWGAAQQQPPTATAVGRDQGSEAGSEGGQPCLGVWKTPKLTTGDFDPWAESSNIHRAGDPRGGEALVWREVWLGRHPRPQDARPKTGRGENHHRWDTVR